ncbi:protein GRIP-like isoform X2 [Quercus lobata]|uniref:protein GRIP-like isoform X2 n=1 Tax=Quercus lobata TaxID=97700 RepID=UPI001249468F|nr:protein GRIP-like isoform X2 [Quercus lobata]
MEAEGGDTAGVLELESHAFDDLKSEKQLPDTNYVSNGNIAVENGLPEDVNPSSDDSHDQFVQMVTELKFQNEFLKSQFEDLKNSQSECSVSNQQTKADESHETEGGESEDVKELRERIESLKRELLEEKQTRNAAEEALKHLTVAYSEADAKAQELSAKLAEAQQKLDQEIKDREEKYSELDSKFSRLHKRAKQRIQDVQKEKDDLEVRFREVSETAERASSQQSALQQELERTRQQANDALKAMDAERQQLRSTNNKLRDTIEELRRSLEPKESALEAFQQSLMEKEQMLEDMRGLFQAADEKRQASIAELSAKHQKNLESLEAQLADALSDRSKATETISSLQVLIAEKESKIAEMDAASTGEAARFRASVESVKGELAHLKHEHDKEKESWEAASQALKTKLELAESNCIRAEIEVAKMRSQLESDVSAQAQILNAKDAELVAAKKEISRLESEFSSYKVRAHALLQKKDAELAAAKDSEQLKVLEEALKEAEKEVLSVSAERDRVLQNLQDALANHDKELKERELVLDNAKQQIKSLEIKLDSANASHQSDKETWEMNLQNIEETWRIRCEGLKAQNEASSGQDVQKELDELKLRYKRLKEEHDTFRDLADRMIEEKDKEIYKLLDDNKDLHQSLESRPPVDHNGNHYTAMQKQDAQNLSTSAAEQQILLLARQQAQREEELAQSQRHILALQEEIEELERENRLHSQQEAMLKTELRNMERMQKREGVDMTYLKNVILKLLETGEVEALLPVIGMLLQFSPEEIHKCQQAYRASTDVPPSPASDGPGSRSLFSRFSFS